MCDVANMSLILDIETSCTQRLINQACNVRGKPRKNHYDKHSLRCSLSRSGNTIIQSQMMGSVGSFTCS